MTSQGRGVKPEKPSEGPETPAQYARYQLNIRIRALFLLMERHFWNGDRDKAEAELYAFILGVRAPESGSSR